MTAASEIDTEVDLSKVRACWAMARLGDGFRDDYMLISIDPPLIGQPYGLGGDDIVELVIAGRLKGDTLFPVSRWPLPVYVFRLLDSSIATSSALTGDDLSMIAWAEVYPTREEAEADVRKWRAARR